LKNYETEEAWRYHNGTKHPNGFLMDMLHRHRPASRPYPYKRYKDCPKVALLPDKSPGKVSALDAISCRKCNTEDIVPDMALLSKLLYFSGGITRSIAFPPPLGRVEFRAASCTGALYHIEMYVVCSGLAGLEDGVYHYDPRDDTLDVLRTGNYLGVLDEATAHGPATSRFPAAIIYTDIFSRNSVKYQAREYRHAFWDCGTILSNSLAVACAHDIPHRLIMGFDDSAVNGLVGVDGKKEASIAMLALGSTQSAPPAPPPLGRTPGSEQAEYAMVSEAILEMHESSSLQSHEVAGWRRQYLPDGQEPSGPTSMGKEQASAESIESVILRRGSTRRFAHEPISLGQMSAVLGRSTCGFDADYGSGTISDVYVIANAVEGLESGSYFYGKNSHTLEELQKGDLRDASGHLGLDQSLPYDASATVFFLTDLGKLLALYGNRGYRVAQIDASVAAGRMYLAAYALGIGATGLTFYDDDVTAFFEPHSRGKSVMFMLALGKKSKA